MVIVTVTEVTKLMAINNNFSTFPRQINIMA